MPRWPKQTLEERFWTHVRKTDTCWLWTAYRDGKGYGVFGTTSHHLVRSHRFSYELSHPPIPDGLMVLHHCDVPSCVNPAHLFLGTNSDNQRDASSKGRHNMQQWPECVNTAILNREKVREIRGLWDRGGYTRAMLAEVYGVSPLTIKDVVLHRTWKVVK